jgi:hypothetical protein
VSPAREETIPILSNFLIEAEGERLNITATDLDQAIRTSAAVKVKKPGALDLPQMTGSIAEPLAKSASLSELPTCCDLRFSQAMSRSLTLFGVKGPHWIHPGGTRRR